MEANFGGLMNFATVRFQPTKDLTTEEQCALIRTIIGEMLNNANFRADQRSNMAMFLVSAVHHLRIQADEVREAAMCKYCGANNHTEENCVYLRRAKQRGEVIT